MSLDFKNGLMTVLALKGGDNSTISGFIYGMIVLAFVDFLAKYIPIIGSIMYNYLNSKYSHKITNSILPKEIKSRITFERYYSNKKDDNITDAVLDYFCKQDSSSDLLYNYFYIVNKNTEVIVNKDICFKILQKDFKDGNIDKIIFEVYSYTLCLSKLKLWANNIFKDYQIDMKNKFGEKRYFFDEVSVSDFSGVADNIHFSMSEFNTNKSLKNIYGTHIDVIKTRIELFLNHPEWYEEKGVPHTLGILLHGPPGTGKTSLIKAIAKDSNRHIFNIKLRKDTTIEQLNDLFYNENVKIFKMGNIIVPLKQRIYVIEDIDCLTDVVLDRKYQNKEEAPDEKKNFKPKTSTIKLSYLLNLFDGVLETPGRILIMSSNYPERLDKALIRPGRIDINLRLGYCDKEMILNMYNSFYKKTEKGLDLPDIKITPAKVQEILCNNFQTPDKAYEQLKNIQDENIQDENIIKDMEEN